MSQKSIQGLWRKLKRRSGQSLLEYALILALIAMAAVLILRGIGPSVNNKLENANEGFE